ncbi:MAG: hypothetical protein KJ697_00340 [Nanoarchaeota archaeon]|nr:hypothetical protein [Nanoarchaeota archaeon]MBU4124236.1 hypothetical protein [Nanoarchaeota archaeon]
MNQKIINQAMIAIIVIGFIIVIAQNQMIINKLYTETPLDRLMALEEMQEFKQGYDVSMEYLTIGQVTELAAQYPEVYSNINKGIYRAQIQGEKNYLVLYDDSEGKILKSFELVADVSQ